MRPRAPLASLGAPRCKECREPVKVTPGLPAREIEARRLGYCSTMCKEANDDG